MVKQDVSLWRNTTHRTMIVSPRKSDKSSIVAGFRVATGAGGKYPAKPVMTSSLTRVVICGCFVYDETIWSGIASKKASQVLLTSNTYDFLGLRIAVEMSFGPGWGGAPLGSAMML
jgi:hypothetical protein